MRIPTALQSANLDDVVQFSCRDYRVKGLDSLCLFRSRGLTLEAHFFDEAMDGADHPPHTHGCDSDIKVLRGSLVENQYRHGFFGDSFIMQAHLVRGGVATKNGDASLFAYAETVHVGGSFTNKAHRHIHSLTNIAAGTVLLVTSFADKAPEYTNAYTAKGQPYPSTEGCYRRMGYLHATRRLAQLDEILTSES